MIGLKDFTQAGRMSIKPSMVSKKKALKREKTVPGMVAVKS